MSLLIKALDKAEKAQAEVIKQEQAKKGQDKRSKPSNADVANQETDSGLSLSPPKAPLLEGARFEPDSIPSSILEGVAVAGSRVASINVIEKPTSKPASQSGDATSTQAANIFSAKRIEATHQNTKLAVIAGAGLIAILGMGAYYYQFVDSAPDVPMPPIRPPHIVAAPPTSAPMPPEVTNIAPESQPAFEVSPEPDATKAFEPREPSKLARKNKANMQSQNMDVAIDNADAVDVDSTLGANEIVASQGKKGTKSNFVKMDKAIASDSASIQVSQTKQQDAVNPILMHAYEEYNAGNLRDAQKLYKQVLQSDASNADAMLGLGAIATQQGRIADANGWNRKVLSLDPRNSIAQAALLQSQQQDDPQTGESHIKSMLAKSPNDANLHAALGNLYAEQNQWAAAQQAYFDAFRLNESAENAFNLGVSLDQMGKPKLALPYYQQALQMAEQSNTSGIDKAALEARIASIQ
jgi:tetratricopeptide (TPR) repeat protein